MSEQGSFQHEFVEFIPETLEEGVLYIAVDHATAMHLCACGCGREVPTPLSPLDWQLIFDGETVSLRPSIGNWSFPCQSHYWIKRGRVEWARKWSKEKIEAGRARARDAKRRAAGLPQESSPAAVARRREEQAPKGALKKLLARLLHWSWR